MALYKYWIEGLGLLLFKLCRLNIPNRKKAKLYDGFFPIYTLNALGCSFRLYCPNVKVFKRYDSIFRKEPETIEWIKGFRPQETLFDIGANIGLYSLLAASAGLKVIAFEPESQNFAVMNANIQLNHLSDKIVPLNLALSDRTTIDYLYMPVFSIGTAFNQFGRTPRTDSEPTEPAAKQAVLSYTVDAFTEAFPDHLPTHIKIDVDGLEPAIIAKALKTLENPKVTSMLVELDETIETEKWAIDFICSKGFTIREKHRHLGNEHNYIFVR
jgi:FkbM family methyltransferase